MRDRLLDHPPPNPNAAHQGPIAMNLPVLLANRMTQVHASSEPTKGRQKSPKVVTTRSNPPRGPHNYLIRLASTCAKSRNPPPNCASWAKPLAVGAAGERQARARSKAERGSPACLKIVGFHNLTRDRSFRDVRQTQAHQLVAPAHDRRHDGAPFQGEGAEGLRPAREDLHGLPRPVAGHRHGAMTFAAINCIWRSSRS